MDDETLRTLITCGFTFGGILVSNLFVFLGTRTNDFLKCQKDEHLSNEFENSINYCYIALSNKLGYSKIQLDPKDKEIVQNILMDTLTDSIKRMSFVDDVSHVILSFIKK